MDKYSTYYKCNGDIEVHVFEDGTEHFELPSNYTWVGTEEEEGVFCPRCSEEINYNGEYVCVHCESTYSESELEDHCGCGVTHG